MTLNYGGFGSRKTPPEIQKEMTKIATFLEQKGFILHTGDADGADKAFKRGVKNSNNVRVFTAHANIPKEAFQIAEHFHPAWYACKPFVMRLLARNSQIILGEFLHDQILFGICWTPNGKVVGGTGHDIRICNGYKIPVYNLAIKNDRIRLKKFLKEL